MSDELDRRFLLGGLAGAAGIAALAQAARGGPLTPPPGAVGSTGKPLAEVEPRTAVNAVNTPPSGNTLFAAPAAGSYYLTGNINVGQNQRGILLPPGSTLDLNGFTITLTASSAIGITTYESCTVRNGRIIGSGAGISTSQQCLLEDIYFEPIFNPSAAVIGAGSVIRRCRFLGGAVNQLSASSSCVVEDCQFANAGTALVASSVTVVRACLFSGCTAAIQVGDGSRVERCHIDIYDATAVQVGARSLVDGCTITNSLTSGARALVLSEGCTVSHCKLELQPTGIVAGTGCHIRDCSFDRHTVAAVKITGTSSIVENCTFTRNNTGVDMLNVGGNYVHKCVMLGTASPIAVNVGGNWYPNIALSGVNSATNPLASVFG